MGRAGTAEMVVAEQGDRDPAPPEAVVLFTCIGRRVALLRCFQEAARRLQLAVSFCGTDTTRLSPALQLCDRAFLVEPTTHVRYLDQLLSIVRDHAVSLLVPTVDLDLDLLARHKPQFEEVGCRVLVSDPDAIDTCRDKRRTFGFLRKNGFRTPRTMSVRMALAADRRGEWTWPCFLKRWDGSGSRDNAVVHDPGELRFFARRIPNALCQEFLDGTEYTCDAYVDFEMQVRCVVPRRRIEVRSGEVSKGQVVKHPQIMDQARRVVELLGAGPGVITLQLFLTSAGSLTFTEINPRLGGGAPLSIRAGADFPRWILEELTGRCPDIDFDGFTDGLMMLRYDAEVWLQDGDRKGTKIEAARADRRR
ncbi:MAG: ATP-grasp domain-containing protein [Planctomycetes bacterium]|nr:ATP-grasp domain-containing protein [Planctomycetota bacterium]